MELQILLNWEKEKSLKKKIKEIKKKKNPLKKNIMITILSLWYINNITRYMNDIKTRLESKNT